jgi:hypothetical protein
VGKRINPPGQPQQLETGNAADQIITVHDSTIG